ncbi:hypothetical protein [Actinomadura macrotermitis]|uniref:HNH endonuclease n=1 Tax=Actinomadura macrotermitis TaxID=2585200 RepID=A0A7K0BZB5_9ACTN|nr:hypothetical protein [Actinomadura macrotermitis]MQY06521.1 hypothetical protein [Actinomadura macrotermitis]
MATALIYVPAPSKGNLQIGIERSLWGWKAETVAKGGTEQVLESLQPGDYLLLGHKGPNARVAAGGWSGARLQQLVVAQITGKVFQDTAPVWPDGVYPFRIRLNILEIQEGVTGEILGDDAMEALRLSANKQGAPVLQQGSAAVDGVIEAVTQQAADSELVDHTADRYLDIDGDLDQRARTLVRKEQQRLRNAKFGKSTRLQCSLCGLKLPARVVHTAHIKRRRNCTFNERRDLANIMGACVLGCDVLFEHGFLFVDGSGIITATAVALADPGLAGPVAERAGKPCLAFDTASSDYFAWHRQHVAQDAS